MLRLRFFNVGDGDAALIEEISGASAFRMLVDCGRPDVPGPEPRMTCAAHLRRAGVSWLDKVLITHLHADHEGGLAKVLDCAQTSEVIASYVPKAQGARLKDNPKALKSVRNMNLHLNRWVEDIGRLRGAGVPIQEIRQSQLGVRLTAKLTADFIVPDAGALKTQCDIWDGLFARRRTSEKVRYQAAKLCNPTSLRLRLHYAGRQAELSADCFGSLWDRGPLEPCDIFKVPHHGDAKALTERLVRGLRPRYAVISCGREYIEAKDRPSMSAVRMLRDAGAEVWYTDAFDDGTRLVMSWPSVDFVIRDDGTILTPM